VPHALEAERDGFEGGTRWCAGLPCVAEERLTEAQREAAEHVYGRARNGFIVFASAAAFVLPAALGICLWAASRLGQHGWIALAVAFALSAMLLPLSAAKALDFARAAMPLRRDLEDGFLWIFQGHLSRARYEEDDPEVASPRPQARAQAARV